jgi:hypothetical protein
MTDQTHCREFTAAEVEVEAAYIGQFHSEQAARTRDMLEAYARILRNTRAQASAPEGGAVAGCLNVRGRLCDPFMASDVIDPHLWDEMNIVKLYANPPRSVDEARDSAYWKDRAHAAEDKIASQSLMDVCRQCDECAPYLKEDETPVQRIERERKDVTACLRLLQVERTLTDIDRLVDRFLAWPLPSSVCPDGCVMNRDYPYRVGTNLLTADEAKAMFIHALGREAAMDARGGEKDK